LAAVHATSGALCLNLVRTWDHRRMRLYLVNYADQPARDVGVVLHLARAVKALHWYAPEGGPSALQGSPSSDGLLLRVPSIDQLGVLEINQE
jgi:hypothetical protein